MRNLLRDDRPPDEPHHEGLLVPDKPPATATAAAVMTAIAVGLAVLLLVVILAHSTVNLVRKLNPPAPQPYMVCVHVVDTPGLDLAGIEPGTECEPIPR